ncbi:MAG TPA: SpoIID/LytB domain-containing protein [Gaiellaceae bacterium]|nr:SpoIID/LytB domain-containing protein [Gaiellaceae bacterium]
MTLQQSPSGSPRPRGRRVRALLAAAALLALLAAASGAPAAPVFVLTGKGWGHGIGLGQYGTRGYAQQGWTYDSILARYYQGTALASGYPNDGVRILLATGRSSVTVGADAAFELAGETLAAGAYTVTPLAGQVKVTGSGTTRIVASPARFEPGTAALELGGLPYRGDLLAASSADGKTIAIVNALARELYLRGVVPREMPSSWLPEALKAQAVAARSYSFAVGGHCVWLGGGALGEAVGLAASPLAALALGQPAAEPVFCADTRDQVYGGKSAETDATTGAVKATAGRVVTYGGSVATTYFFSTSGGRTAAKADEWGGAAVPYLVSVSDPYDTISPHHVWGPADAEVDCAGTARDCVFTAAQVESGLGLALIPVDLRVTARNSSGRVALLEATTPAGTTTFSGTTARTKLALRSTWFSVGVLSLERSATTVVYGGKVKLSGLARSGGTAGWDAAHLQRRPYGATAWTTVGEALPRGAWTKTVRPPVRTDYRAVSGNATGAAARVKVRTRVTFSVPRKPYTRLAGAVGPARAGISVTLERKRADGTWKLVATTSTKADGGFSFTISRLGTYRARADAGGGYVAGGATVTVPPS